MTLGTVLVTFSESKQVENGQCDLYRCGRPLRWVAPHFHDAYGEIEH